MSLDWDIYSKQILQKIEENKSELFEDILSPIKDFIDNNIYWNLEEMVPILDLNRDDLTVRLSWDCSADFKDDRNILFSLKEEISKYDNGDFKRLDRLKVIFQNCNSLIECRIKELEKEWGRD